MLHVQCIQTNTTLMAAGNAPARSATSEGIHFLLDAAHTGRAPSRLSYGEAGLQDSRTLRLHI